MMPQEQLSYEGINYFCSPCHRWCVWVLLGCCLPSVHLLSFYFVLFGFVLVVVCFLSKPFLAWFFIYFKNPLEVPGFCSTELALKSGLHCDSRISFCYSCPLVQTPWWEIQLCTESISCFFAHIIIMSCTHASMSAPLRCSCKGILWSTYQCFFF